MDLSDSARLQRIEETLNEMGRVVVDIATAREILEVLKSMNKTLTRILEETEANGHGIF